MAERGTPASGVPPRPARILVVDDHPVVRDGLAAQVATEPGLTVCCATGDPTEALVLIRSNAPDLVIVDIGLGDRSGLDLIRQIRSHGHANPILVWSMHPESVYAERALRAGAQGYIEKSRASRDMVEAIRAVLEGKIYVSAAFAARMVQRLGSHGPVPERSGIESLSNRELRAFELMGAGTSTPEIARQMSVSPKTVETYRARIKQKLGLSTFAEVIQRATAWVLERR